MEKTDNLIETISIPKLVNAILKHHSKAEIARRLGKSWQTIYYWQRGVFKPSGDSLTKLWEMYDGDKSSEPEA